MTARFIGAIRRTVPVWLLASSFVACNKQAPPPQEPPPPLSLPWQPLALPRSELSLPAFLVGDDKRPSSACFEALSATEGTSLDSGTWTLDLSNEFEASLKASFVNALVDAALEAEVARAMTQRWSVEVSGLSYSSVDAADVRANFENEACTDTDLGYFKDKRFVATEGLKAATVRVKTGSALSTSEMAKLNVAIDAINLNLDPGFQHAVNTSDSGEFTATDVFIGVAGTTLGAIDCRLEAPLPVVADAQVPVCGGKYLVALSKSGMTGRYTFKITPQRAATSELDAPLGNQAVFKLGKLQVVFVLAEPSGDGFTLQTLEVLKVGANG